MLKFAACEAGAEELAKAAKSPAVTEKRSAQGMEVRAGPPWSSVAIVPKEIPRWAKVPKDYNIKPGDQSAQGAAGRLSRCRRTTTF